MAGILYLGEQWAGVLVLACLGWLGWLMSYATNGLSQTPRRAGVGRMMAWTCGPAAVLLAAATVLIGRPA